MIRDELARKLPDPVFDINNLNTLPGPRVVLSEIDRKYRRLMPIAEAYAQRSKYEGTRVGAAIFGVDFEPLSAGWNGAARGCKADEDSRSFKREERLFWAVHAEANAIANAARSGARLKGSTLVVTHTPCMACAKLVVQAGIARVISPVPDGDFAAKWAEDFKRTRQLFKECGVDFIET